MTGPRPGWASRLIRDADALSAKARLVGLVLATFADQRTGEAWPKLDTLAAGSGLSKSGVQRALRELEFHGLIRTVARLQYSKRVAFQNGQHCDHSEARPDRSTSDHSEAVQTGQIVTTLKPARLVRADVQTGQGGRSRPVKAVTTRTFKGTSKEGSLTASPRAKPEDFPRPDFVDPQVWTDFLKNRSRKRLPNTATAHRKLLADLAKLTTDDWSPAALFEHATAKGWGAIYPPGERTLGNGRTSDDRGRPGGDSLVELWRQAAADERAEAAQGQRNDAPPDPGTGLAVSAH